MIRMRVFKVILSIEEEDVEDFIDSIDGVIKRRINCYDYEVLEL